MPRIVTRNEAGKAQCRQISNYYGDVASDEIVKFCGQNVIDEIDRRLKSARGASTTVHFEKDGRYYQLYKGPNRTRTKAGRYGYNVYLCSGSR